MVITWLVANRRAREEKHDCAPGVEVPAYPDSLSLPSEPPDIANWFSSYVYESPELDSADFHVSAPVEHKFGIAENVDSGKEEQLKELNVTRDTNGKFSCRGTIGKDINDSAVQKQQDSEANNLPSEDILCPDESIEREEFGTRSIIADKFAIYPKNSDDLTPIAHRDQQTNEAGYLISFTKVPSTKTFTETCDNETKETCTVAENDSGWIQLKHKSRESHCKRLNKDEGQHTFTDTGFTSIKKKSGRRINNENLPDRSGPSICQNDMNVNPACSTVNKKAGLLKTEVLKETTNIHHSYALESTGKWRCPLKNKPNRGPSLKQLRLEKWVHQGLDPMS